jgi:isochorismate synthase
VSVPLGPAPAIDPYALAGHDGVLFADDRLALAGRGTAAVLDLPAGLQEPADLAAAQAWLAAVPHADRVGQSGSKVTAFGAMDFDRSAGSHLLVPRVTYGRDDQGNRWATVIASGPGGPDPVCLETLGADLAGLCRPTGGAHLTARRDPVVTCLPPGDDYARSVAAAVARIAGGTLRKVVLARGLEVRFEDAVTPGLAVRRLHAQEPLCTIFAFPAGAGGVSAGRFLGASPELLVRRRGSTVTCHPLAGTLGLAATGDARAVTGDRTGGRTGGEAVQRFLASPKDRVEHQLVVDEIVAALRDRCAALSVPATPSLVRLRTVAHLGTLVQGTLRTRVGSDGPPSVLELLADLHPTPAVGGVPRSEALACIASLEPQPRGHWAGPVGWVDSAGDGEWMIGIRSATVVGRTVRLTAGAGVVAASDPRAELAETTVKLVSVLDAFAPGAAHLL